MTKPYQKLAAFYDDMMGERYANLWWKAFATLANQEFLRYASVADLAGGTGTIACHFSSHPTYIIDQSPEMLAIAKRKIPRAQCLQQDLQHLSLPAPVDLAICAYGGIHYLKSTRVLQRVFTRVRQALMPGGYFCLDQYSTRFLKTKYGKGEKRYSGRGYTSIWRFLWDAKKNASRIVIHGFEGEPEAWHEHWTEQHWQYAFSLDEIREALKAAGFVRLRAYGLPGLGRPGPRDDFRILLAQAP